MEVTDSTLLILLGLGFIINANGLPHLPFKDHAEILGGFLMRINMDELPRKVKIVVENPNSYMERRQ